MLHGAVHRADGQRRARVATGDREAPTVAVGMAAVWPIDRRARCRRRYARNAAPLPRYRLCHVGTGRSIAVIVMRKCAELRIAGAGEDY
jgi:hypothetical protein